MLSKSILQLLAYFSSATVDCFYSALDNIHTKRTFDGFYIGSVAVRGDLYASGQPRWRVAHIWFSIQQPPRGRPTSEGGRVAQV